MKYLILSGFLLQGCVPSNDSTITDKQFQTIQGKEWTRHNEEWDETLLFDDDGKFYYYYPDAGNAVDDYDLCDTYDYDETDGSIHLNCEGTEIIDVLKVKELDEDILKLDFNGEIREFQKKYIKNE